MCSPVTGSIFDIFTLKGFEECCRINERCKAVDKCNFLSPPKSSGIFQICIWIRRVVFPVPHFVISDIGQEH